MRVAEFAADWPYSHPRPDPTTNLHYRQMVGKFVARFGTRDLTALSTGELQVWAQDNLSAVRYVRAMFADALADGHVAVNPLLRVKVARAPRRRRDDAVPTLEQVETLLGDEDRQLAACVALGAFAGLRAGEILGLQLGERAGSTSSTRTCISSAAAATS
jgi:integrase